MDAARGKGIEWIHVDYEPHLRTFYEKCGFRQTEAGLMKITEGCGFCRLALNRYTIRKPSFRAQRRRRLKLRQVVMPSPVGLAMVNEV